MAHKLMILSPLRKHCGNSSTAERLRSYFADKFTCVMKGTKDFSHKDELQQFIQTNHVSVIIALHAYHSGMLLIDINVYTEDVVYMAKMTEAVSQAKYIVAFSEVMLQKAVELWPWLDNNRMKIISQGVHVSLSPAWQKYNFKRDLISRGLLSHGDRAPVYIFLLIAGIRPVKDPMYLLDAFTAWHKEFRQAYMVILGPELDPALTEDLKDYIKSRCEGVCYYGGVDKERAHAYLKQSYALINSSISEGMSVAILEAMKLRVPVLARDIPSNAAVITHGHSGLLFSTPESFITQAKELVSNQDLHNRLSTQAKQIVDQQHSCEKERQQYHTLVSNALTR